MGGWGKLARRTGGRFWVNASGGGGGGGIGRCDAFAATFTVGAFALYCRIGGGGGGGGIVVKLLAKGITFGVGVGLKVFN